MLPFPPRNSIFIFSSLLFFLLFLPMKRVDTVALRRIRLNGTIFLLSAFSPISTPTKSCLRIVSFGGRGAFPLFPLRLLLSLSLSLSFQSYSIAPRRNEIIPSVRIKEGAFNLKTFAMNAPFGNWLNNSFDEQNFPGSVFFCDASRNAISRRAFFPPPKETHIFRNNVQGKRHGFFSLFACQLQGRKKLFRDKWQHRRLSRCRKFDFEMKTFCSVLRQPEIANERDIFLVVCPLVNNAIQNRGLSGGRRLTWRVLFFFFSTPVVKQKERSSSSSSSSLKSRSSLSLKSSSSSTRFIFRLLIQFQSDGGTSLSLSLSSFGQTSFFFSIRFRRFRGPWIPRVPLDSHSSSPSRHSS